MTSVCVSSDESISETEKKRGSQNVFSALTYAGGDGNTVTMVTDDVLLDSSLSLFFPCSVSPSVSHFGLLFTLSDHLMVDPLITCFVNMM